MNSEQLYELGYNYQHGICNKKDEKKAFEYYMKAAELGNLDAMHAVGNSYYFGIGVERNNQKSFEYYMKAAELGNPDAMHAVGMCYYYEVGVERNNQKSFEYYKRSADLEVASATNGVGTCYESGRGVDKNYNKAFKYYEKAANMGERVSMSNVARCYRNGIGIKRNIQKANYWFTKYRNLLKTNESPDQINPELKRILDDERFKLSWIDYNEFRIVNEMGKGGFATVYGATWFDRINNMWWNVALKVIHDSNKNEQEFIQELKNYCEIGYENPSFLNCYGVSRNDHGDYVIVMQIAPKNSLRQNLVQVSKSEWKDKLNILYCVAVDLVSIHSQGLVHGDLHSGNILQAYLDNAYISDLGLSKKAKDGKICGILPFIAPEVLVGQPYTQASDIYSLGVIATEISTGQRAFDGIPFNGDLVSKIIGGSRPKCLGPNCYIELTMKCMDKDFYKRPIATEIIEIITHWLDEMDQEDDTEIKKQFLEADKAKPEPIKQLHSQETYISKLYDTKNFSEYFSKPISERTNSQI